MNIKGRCIDDIKPLIPDSERGIAGVKVTISGQETLTDAGGFFSFKDLPEGEYEIHVCKENQPCYAFYDEIVIVDQDCAIEFIGYCVS